MLRTKSSFLKSRIGFYFVVFTILGFVTAVTSVQAVEWDDDGIQTSLTLKESKQNPGPIIALTQAIIFSEVALSHFEITSDKVPSVEFIPICLEQLFRGPPALAA